MGVGTATWALASSSPNNPLTTIWTSRATEAGTLIEGLHQRRDGRDPVQTPDDGLGGRVTIDAPLSKNRPKEDSRRRAAELHPAGVVQPARDHRAPTQSPTTKPSRAPTSGAPQIACQTAARQSPSEAFCASVPSSTDQ
jgi:hypothetical protein